LQPKLDAARNVLASAEARHNAARAENTAAQNRATDAIATDYATGGDSYDALRQAGDAAKDSEDADALVGAKSCPLPCYQLLPAFLACSVDTVHLTATQHLVFVPGDYVCVSHFPTGWLQCVLSSGTWSCVEFRDFGVLGAHPRQINHEGSNFKRHLVAVRDGSLSLGLQQRQGIVPWVQLDTSAQG
jgi:hypothetical protein